MLTSIVNQLLRVVVFLTIAVVTSCGPDNSRPAASQPATATKKQNNVSLSYQPQSSLTAEKSVSVSVASNSDTVGIDSVRISFNGAVLLSTTAPAFELPLKALPMGQQTIKAEVFLTNGAAEQQNIRLTIFAASPPQKYTYRKLATYTHDPDAYTQGLVYHNDMLFESTGTRGESSLRQVELSSGKVVKQINLDDKHFGEGLAVWQNMLIQLTWTSHIGFAYDLETFDKLKTFNYPTEGWGLAVFENELVMSDGTENLYFLDPETFTEKRRLQVYDNQKKVGLLNELEVIDGLIYANVYQTDTIVMIDPATGAVAGEIDLTGIFNSQGYNRRLDVLNGIAWDSRQGRIFVTGKWWPKLYAIEIINHSI